MKRRYIYWLLPPDLKNGWGYGASLLFLIALLLFARFLYERSESLYLSHHGITTSGTLHTFYPAKAPWEPHRATFSYDDEKQRKVITPPLPLTAQFVAQNQEDPQLLALHIYPLIYHRDDPQQVELIHYGHIFHPFRWLFYALTSLGGALLLRAAARQLHSAQIDALKYAQSRYELYDMRPWRATKIEHPTTPETDKTQRQARQQALLERHIEKMEREEPTPHDSQNGEEP